MDKQIIAVGGGKGGVGKSIISSNLSVSLAQAGHRTVLVDADLGGANIHTMFGIDRPKGLLEHFIDRKIGRLDEILVPSEHPNLQLVCGGMPVLGSANPKHSQKTKLIRHIRMLDADIIVVDVGAGIGFNVLDLFNSAEFKIVAFTPQLTSLHNGYGFLKAAIHRRLERLVDKGLRQHLEPAGAETGAESLDDVLRRLARHDPDEADKARTVLSSQKISLIGNMVRTPKERHVIGALGQMIRDHLLIEAPMLGVLKYGEKLERSVNDRRPFMLWAGIETNAETFRVIAHKLLEAHSRSRVHQMTRPSIQLASLRPDAQYARQEPRYPAHKLSCILRCGKTEINGTIKNIAHGGMLVDFKQVTPDPAEGILIIRSQMADFDVEVKVEQRHRSGGGARIGFLFIDMDSYTQKSINEMVAGAAAAVAVNRETPPSQFARPPQT